ncbi:MULTISPECIES: transcription antitermination factor NusB [Cellulophaga]|uniref:Antitermination protein NusB n=1 Tax=Cellulophaga baltica 18 TaxID=1348584 RepID=A0AAU8RL22_9FLAO|nr:MULTISPECIES: transcription antitermination factor NusB [Cellulophaga]WFO16068.1 transcription antitermination factor NusB [Cellulophaga baltica 4]AIZ43477.1 antitermination protein NusB [Cellulophaga baltica 18]MBA6314564.1 transcription antitermination factor NusB [Cellulophaga baltica]QXP53737.1 transcription antitermination factor NusB [Cellulophaga sp. HaHa_2_1]QXP57666.1 transcription antitermination factor NusB [Cellulophaga sp. HaHa_2_95]
MLTRRHVRVKVMQCIYALTRSNDDSLEKQQKFLKFSIENTYSLYLLMMSLMKEIHDLAKQQVELSANTYLSSSSNTFDDKKKFVNNRFIKMISENKVLEEELEIRKLQNWYLNDEYVKLLYKEIIASNYYNKYMHATASSFEDDKQLIVDLFKNIIAPNEKIYDYFEDDKLTWVDDIPLVNTFILKLLKKAKPDAVESYFLPPLVKDQEDVEFSKKLLSKTLLQNEKLVKEIEGKTPNWDKDRIADIDAILLKMAIAELLNFPSIPERVTINEYLELAKEYSTPKSSTFINGILDKLIKEYEQDGKLNKIGRGLL